MLQSLSNQEYVEQKEQELNDASVFDSLVNDKITPSLSSHIRTCWERNKRHKRKITERLLNCLRIREGEYDSKTLQEIRSMGGSDIFMHIGATKMRACAAWVKDILLPANDHAWGIESTPIPEVPPEIESAIMNAAMESVQGELQQMVEQGQVNSEAEFMQLARQRMEQLKHEVIEEAEKESKKAAEKQQKLIEDQLAESDWKEAISEFIDDFSTFPTGILKGPIIRKKPTIKWVEGKPVVSEELRYDWKRVSPFDMYPSAGAVKVEDGDLIEHIRLERHSIYACLGVPGYDDEAIRKVLDEYDTGYREGWIQGQHEREELENREDEQLEVTGLIDAIQFWGRVQGRLLLDWGINSLEIDDELAEYEIDAIMIGNHVIRAVINDDPLHRRPYQKASYQRTPGSWWGVAPVELMEDIQRMCNATARALSNNLSISSGPMMGILEDRLNASDDPTDVRPWKVWRFRSSIDSMSGSKEDPIRFFQPQSNANELIGVYEQFKKEADDATGIPRYTYGNERVGGAAATKGGLSMLLENAAKGIRASIANMDLYVIRPAIEKLWFFNMVYNNDIDTKHDAKVVARGLAALVVKEQQQARRMELMQFTANPIDMEIIGTEGRARMLKEAFKEIDMPDVVPSVEQLALKNQNAQQQEDPKTQIEEAKLVLEQQKLELEEKKVDIDAQIKEMELRYKK